MRVAVTPERDRNHTGEVEFGYVEYSDFSDWVDAAFGLPNDRRPHDYPDLERSLDRDGEEYTPEFVQMIAARFPNPWATPYPGIIQLFLDAAAKGVAVHKYM